MLVHFRKLPCGFLAQGLVVVLGLRPKDAEIAFREVGRWAILRSIFAFLAIGAASSSGEESFQLRRGVVRGILWEAAQRAQTVGKCSETGTVKSSALARAP